MVSCTQSFIKKSNLVDHDQYRSEMKRMAHRAIAKFQSFKYVKKTFVETNVNHSLIVGRRCATTLTFKPVAREIEHLELAKSSQVRRCWPCLKVKAATGWREDKWNSQHDFFRTYITRDFSIIVSLECDANMFSDRKRRMTLLHYT